MISVIVFTKDRPMQLDAYLEGLMYYSNLNENQISIIYKKNKKINYKKVIEKYSNCNWVYEDNFYKDLIKVIDQSEEFIIFGCDDVVFKNNLPIEYAKNLLKKNKEIFGFSFRLGKNIKPIPNSVVKINRLIEWEWADVTEAHYNYPWELDCTLYRKGDIQNILNSFDGNITNPYYLESIFADNPRKFIKRPKLACKNDENQSIVITVNRVQDTHLNPVDSSESTSVEYLDYIYNKKNKKLDIRKILKLKNNKIHVGGEYFILEGGGFIKSSNQAKNIKIFYRKIIRLGKNIIKNRIPFQFDINSAPYKDNCLKDKLKVVHGLNRYGFKGTKFVESAFNDLRKYPNINCEILERLSYVEFCKRIQNSNVVIDQLNSYSYAYTAINALAMGKVIITGCESDFLNKYNIEKCASIINGIPESNDLIKIIREISSDSYSLGVRGAEGRDFINTHHNYISIAKKYLETWSS